MTKLSIALAAAGLALVLWSFVPGATLGNGQLQPGIVMPAATDAAAGKALFAAKGCATCHVNQRADLPAQRCCPGAGPDLTSYRNDPAYLRRWLADPAAVKPSAEMPNLNLSPAEIEALIAFLNDRSSARSR